MIIMNILHDSPNGGDLGLKRGTLGDTGVAVTGISLGNG